MGLHEVMITGRRQQMRVWGVDESRSDLERLDFIVFAKGCHQSHCDCGFPTPLPVPAMRRAFVLGMEITARITA